MEPLKVIIIDDERIIRFGIASMINWEALGLKLAGEASNGEEGYELFLEKNPDIVISDIKMPVLDGIEMIKKIKQYKEETRFIILSGYEDFSYAKEAIRLGVSEYLLKSDLMPEDIEAILRRIVEGIKKERGLEFAEESQTRKVGLRDTVYEICHGMRLVSEEEIDERDLRKIESGYFCVYIGARYEGEEEHQPLQRVSGNIEESLRGFWEKQPGVLFSDGKNVFGGVIFGGEDLQPILNSEMEKLIYEIKSEQDCIVTIGCSRWNNRFTMLHLAFDEALETYRSRMFQGCGTVIWRKSIGESVFLQQERCDLSLIEKSIEYHDEEMLTGAIGEFFYFLKKRADYEETNLASLELMVLLNSVAERFFSEELMFERKKKYYQELIHFEYIDEIEDWFLQEFKLLILESRKKIKDKGKIIEFIKNYIESHYAEDITLQSLSEMVYLNKNYISNLFKKEVGKSPNEYLMETRMNAAKQMLLHTDMSAKEVAERVGYDDERYFYKVFKRVTGYTAMEYSNIKR